MRRRQIRKKDSSSDSSEEDNTAQCESAIAALKAKRAPGVKARKPVPSALGTSDEGSTAIAEPTVASHPEPRPPFASATLVEKPGTRTAAEVAVKPRAEPPSRAANATTLPRRSRDALVDIEAAVGFEPLPEFIPLDMSRRVGTAQPHGRSKLEAMVSPSSSEDSADDTPAVVSEQNVDVDVDMENLDAVRKQLKGNVASRAVAAPALGAASSLTEGQSLHSLLDKYASMLAKTQNTLEQDTRALLRASQESSSAGALVAKLDAELSVAASQFEFFQENRRWTRSLCGFLTTKSVELTSLETEMDLAASDCAIDTACRHAADLLDEVAECAARGDERLLVAGILPDELPEIPPSSVVRETGMVLSAEARLLKRRARQRKAAVVLGHGPSLARAAAAGDAECAALSECEHSDSEVSDARLKLGEHLSMFIRTRFRREIVLCRCAGRLRSKRDAMLADVLPEYADMATVCQRLSVWRRDFGQSYEDAYVSMSLADVFSLYVRMEVRWPCYAIELCSYQQECSCMCCSCLTGSLVWLHVSCQHSTGSMCCGD